MRSNRFFRSAVIFVVALSSVSLHHPGLFGWDTCADTCIVNDVGMLSDPEPCLGIQVRGVTGISAVTHIGTLNLRVKVNDGSTLSLSFPNTMVLPGCPNIVCASDVLRNTEVVAATLKQSESVLSLSRNRTCKV